VRDNIAARSVAEVGEVNTVFYSVDGSKYCYALKTNLDLEDDGEWIAEQAADDYHSNHDGWEGHWPKDIRLHETDGGPVVATYEVEREYSPEFSAELKSA